jgi:hypothetical protein
MTAKIFSRLALLILILSLVCATSCTKPHPARYKDVSIAEAEQFVDTLIARVDSNDCKWPNQHIAFGKMMDSAAGLKGWNEEQLEEVRRLYWGRGMGATQSSLCQLLLRGYHWQIVSSFESAHGTKVVIRSFGDDGPYILALSVKQMERRQMRELMVVDIWHLSENEAIIEGVGKEFAHLFPAKGETDTEQLDQLGTFYSLFSREQWTKAARLTDKFSAWRAESISAMDDFLHVAKMAGDTARYSRLANELLTAFPHNPGAQYTLRDWLSARGRKAEAIAGIRALADSIHQMDASLMTEIGYCHFIAKDFPSAIAAADSALDLEEELYNAHYLRFHSLVQAGDFATAMVELSHLEGHFEYDLNDAGTDSMTVAFRRFVYQDF